jgi:hypothetical protein
MTRTFQDDDLLLWEVYAASPRRGRDQDDRERARMLFHCLTAPGRRARVLTRDEGRAALEATITAAGPVELVEMLAASETLD